MTKSDQLNTPASLGPVALDALGQSFEEAWQEIAGNFSGMRWKPPVLGLRRSCSIWRATSHFFRHSSSTPPSVSWPRRRSISRGLA